MLKNKQKAKGEEGSWDMTKTSQVLREPSFAVWQS